MAKRVTIQLVKQLICILMVAVVLAPIILVLFASWLRFRRCCFRPKAGLPWKIFKRS